MVGIMLVALCELSKILSRPAQSRPGFLIDPLKKLAVRLMPHSPSWNLDEYNEVEARINAKSTYFLLVHPSEESCRRCCVRLDLLQEAAVRIAEKGHEIGLHGSCASSDNASQMMKEKNELESILSKRTDGVRQHLLKMCLPETWEYQQEAGFVYDASLGYNQLVGFRAGTCFPFTPWDSEGEKRFTILELPLVVQDKALFGDSNADCILKKAFDKCGKLLDVTYNHNGVFTVLWHACVSRVTKPYLVDFYRKMIKYASRYDPWYANCTSLTSWWKLRSKIRLEPEKVIKSELEFSAVSPEDFEGFSISLHLPKNPRAVQVFIRDKRLDDEKILRKEDELLISFDLVEGKNQVKILC
jgi:peptidoglycan/xylan/chitin deacetylase (PgdA/CDA1 family)